MQPEPAHAREDLLASLRRLSDADLVARVKSLAARERGVTALLVAHLAELDMRDVHLRAASPPSSPTAGRSSRFPSTRPTTGSRSRARPAASPWSSSCWPRAP